MIGKLHQPVHSVFSNIDIIPNLDQVVNIMFIMSGPSVPAQEY